MSITTKNTFESALVQSLVKHGGYTEGNAPDYSPDLGILMLTAGVFIRNRI